MVNTSTLREMTRKWKRFSWHTKSSSEAADFSKAIVYKGHFVVYTSEGKRFMVPLTFLNNTIFEELLKRSEEEFGLPRHGPITLPCDAAFLESVLPMLIQMPKDTNHELLVYSFMKHCSRYFFEGLGNNQQLAVF